MKGAEEQEDSFYLCFNCGEITPEAEWTYWQPDHDQEFGEAEYRPHGLLPTDSDALQKCPRCGEMHGDNYVGSGVQDGTRDQCEAERESMLRAEGTAEEWAKALAEADLPEEGVA